MLTVDPSRPTVRLQVLIVLLCIMCPVQASIFKHGLIRNPVTVFGVCISVVVMVLVVYVPFLQVCVCVCRGASMCPEVFNVMAPYTPLFTRLRQIVGMTTL